MDANTFAQEEGPEAFRQTVRDSIWYGREWSEEVSQKSDLSAEALAKEENHSSNSTIVASSLAANLAAKKEDELSLIHI